MIQKYIIFIFLILGLAGCQNTPSKYIYNQGFVYGTMYSIIYESPRGIDLQDEITEKFKEYTMVFSTYDKESVISKVNENRSVKLTPEFLICYNRAMEVSEITNGAFDITAGPMVNAWGFGPEKRKIMTKEKIDSLIEITGYHKIRLENGKIIKDNPNMKLDMSAIAKGYTSDLIANFLKAKGCENYMVEIGGEVAAKGKNERGKIWTIGISKPEELVASSGGLEAKIQLPDHALATSGNYRNFYEEDGKKYAHTIDPKTGYPVQHNLLSATVLANDCMSADAFATAFMVLELDAGIEIARNIPEIEVYFIYTDEQGNTRDYMSEGFKQYLLE